MQSLMYLIFLHVIAKSPEVQTLVNESRFILMEKRCILDQYLQIIDFSNGYFSSLDL